MLQMRKVLCFLAETVNIDDFLTENLKQQNSYHNFALNPTFITSIIHSQLSRHGNFVHSIFSLVIC